MNSRKNKVTALRIRSLVQILLLWLKYLHYKTVIIYTNKQGIIFTFSFLLFTWFWARLAGPAIRLYLFARIMLLFRAQGWQKGYPYYPSRSLKPQSSPWPLVLLVRRLALIVRRVDVNSKYPKLVFENSLIIAKSSHDTQKCSQVVAKCSQNERERPLVIAKSSHDTQKCSQVMQSLLRMNVSELSS